MPYTNYDWGVYYRTDMHEELGLEPPQDWETLKSNCQTILDSGRKCFATGTKFLWPAAGWFDYINLRTHGYDFHVALTNGEIAWTDDRVRETFANWRELIDMGAYIDSHTAYSYQEAIPFMINGEAVEYLMGNFIVPVLLDGALTIDQVGLYQFSEITPDIPMAEDAPTEMYAIPSGAENKDLARAFLKFIAEPEVQTTMNSEEYLARLPVNSQSSVATGNLVPEGYEILRDNSPGGIAQFFDRDTPAEIAQVAMEGFQRFMVRPDDLDMILQNIERTRERVQN